METGWDSFGARGFDARIGKWLGVDPMAEKYPDSSPYNYCSGNPLRYVDPTGKNWGEYTDEAAKRERKLKEEHDLEVTGPEFGTNYVPPQSSLVLDEVGAIEGSDSAERIRTCAEGGAIGFHTQAGILKYAETLGDLGQAGEIALKATEGRGSFLVLLRRLRLALSLASTRTCRTVLILP